MQDLYWLCIPTPDAALGTSPSLKANAASLAVSCHSQGREMVMTSQLIPQVPQCRFRGDKVKAPPPPPQCPRRFPEGQAAVSLPCAVISAFSPTTHPGRDRNREQDTGNAGRQ